MAGLDRPVDVVDVAIGVGLILLALGAVFGTARKGSVMFFLGAGALMIPVWLRVGSVDMALAEAPVGELSAAAIVSVLVNCTKVHCWYFHRDESSISMTR